MGIGELDERIFAILRIKRHEVKKDSAEEFHRVIDKYMPKVKSFYRKGRWWAILTEDIC